MSPTLISLSVAAVALVVGIAMLAAGRRHAVRVAKWTGALWLAYAIYELGVQVVTPEANIRVDLLLFYPVLLISAIWAVIALLRRPRTA